ncbi:IS3 family transposase [Bacillus sp. LJBS17]|uniref:IS3 family transposase n=1 Tax=Bacillus sp. LJBS17 TaxID=2859227 RepID=UPI001C570D3C|nr:IS3 family transposase [Bacillus sp. LJBS17]
MVQHSKDSNGKGTERSDHKRAHHGIHHSRPFYGYPRITVALKKEGFCINHKRVYRLMKDMNIQSIIRKKTALLWKKSIGCSAKPA